MTWAHTLQFSHVSHSALVLSCGDLCVWLQLFRLVPTLLLLGALFYMTRSAGGAGGSGGLGNVFKIGRSNAKKFKKEDVSVTFKDVAGVDEAKREVCIQDTRDAYMTLA